MKIQTKFNLGQVVYPISKGQVYEWVSCSTCQGIGMIIVRGSNEELVCPSCFGRRGENKYMTTKWQLSVDCISCIGKVEVELYSQEYVHEHDSKTRYMLEATGIGSGSLWDEANIFASHDEAAKECEKRNKLL